MEFDIYDDNLCYNLLISLRNQFVNGNDKDLVELYRNNEEEFYNFLLANIYLKEIEPDFYLLNRRYLDSVLKIISYYRKDMDADCKSYVNDMIGFANEMNSLDSDSKKNRVNNYLEYQQDLRRVTYDDNYEFIKSLGYDGVVLQSLYNNSLEHIDNDSLFLMSINYFLEVIPSIFLDDGVCGVVFEVANRYKNSLKFYEISKRRYVDDTMMVINDTNSFYHDVLQKVK